MHVISLALEPDTIPAQAAADVVLWIGNDGKDICTDIRLSVVMPEGLVRLRGEPRILVDRLRPGERQARPLRLCAQQGEMYVLAIKNLSYRDRYGEDIAQGGRFLPLHAVQPQPATSARTSAAAAPQPPAGTRGATDLAAGAAPRGGRLTGKQVDMMKQALLGAFDEPTLRQLLRIRLDVVWDEVVEGGTFTAKVFSLIEWAEKNGRVADLLRAAAGERPHNQELQTVADQVLVQ